MNTYSRSQGMDNRLNMLFNQELDNEAQYIKSHPFSAINMSLGGEVRYIAPIWPWNAPRFQAIDWRTQAPPERIPGNSKHNRGGRFVLPKTWIETTNKCWDNDAKPPACFPYSTAEDATKDSAVIMTAGARRSYTNTPASRPPQTRDSERDAEASPQQDGALPADGPPYSAREQTQPHFRSDSRPPSHPRLSSGQARSRPDSHAGYGGSRGGSDRESRGTPTRPPSDRAPRLPTSRPPTNGSGGRRDSAGPPVEPLRLDLPASQLPGRPKTNASNPRLSVRSNGSARRAAQEVVGSS